MPKVGKKRFPYTSKGKEDAKRYKKKVKRSKKRAKKRSKKY